MNDTDYTGVLGTAAMILDECRAEIQANMAKTYRTADGQERRVNASGRSAAAFKVEKYDGGVRLVYEGSDVAPLESIQYGQDGSEPPTVADIMRWWREKFGEDITEGRAEAIVRKIARDGTERWREPQEWIITPEVDKAAAELVKIMGDEMVKVMADIF